MLNYRDLANLAVWLDTKQPTYVDNIAAISSARNKGNQGVGDAFQATASRKPTWSKTTTDNLPGIELQNDGSIDFLQISDHAGLNYTSFSMFLVYTPKVVNSTQQLICKTISNSGVTADAEFLIGIDDSAKYFGYYSTNGTSYQFPASTDVLSINTRYLLEVHNHGAGTVTWRGLLNGVAGSKGFNHSPSSNVFNGAGDLYIGANGAFVNNAGKGYIHELLLFNNVLRQDLKDIVRTNLLLDWNINGQ